MKKLSFLLLLFMAACSHQRKLATAQQPASPSQAVAAPQPSDMTVADGKLFTAFFQQRAAEYRALCLQAYNIARMRLDAQLATPGKPKAVITDLDETALDNSAYAVHRGLQGLDWEQQSWYDWTGRAEADTVPGAPSFFKYAASKGVQVFYITNRDEHERAATLQNLRKYDFPNADDAHLFPRKDTSSKEFRRQLVMNNFEVVLLLGDNLADFSPLFDARTETERKANVDATTTLFGNRFIVLPNPNYGDWEGALYRAYHYRRPSAAQKDSIIRAALHSY